MKVPPPPWDDIDPPRRARFIDDKPGVRAIQVVAGRPKASQSGRHTQFLVKTGGSGARWVAADRVEFLDS